MNLNYTSCVFVLFLSVQNSFYTIRRHPHIHIVSYDIILDVCCRHMGLWSPREQKHGVQGFALHFPDISFCEVRLRRVHGFTTLHNWMYGSDAESRSNYYHKLYHMTNVPFIHKNTFGERVKYSETYYLLLVWEGHPVNGKIVHIASWVW